jgi:integrase
MAQPRVRAVPLRGGGHGREVRRELVRDFPLRKLSDGESGQGERPGRETKRAKPRKKLARGSVRSIYHTLSAVLTEAVEDRLIPVNPIRGLWRTLSKGKAGKGAAKRVKAMDSDQARRFLEAAPPDHLPYFATLMLAGLRPSEGMAVTAEKIDLRARSLLVDLQVGQHGGIKTPKDGESRTVDLSAGLASILGAAMKARQAAVVPIDAKPAAPWLFYPELGHTPSTKDVQRVYKNALRAMRRALAVAGLPEHFSLHSLRHTFGSGLISRGVSPAYVQAQMGHASVQMTVDEYGSWLPVRVPGAVDLLADAIVPAPTRGHQMDTSGSFAEAVSA